MLIDGKEYEVPLISSFTFKEARVWYQETGTTMEQALFDLWSERDGAAADLFANPGTLSAYVRIAYMREHPAVPDEVVVEIVERQNRLSILGSLITSADDDESEEGKDEGTTSVPNRSSKRSKGGKRSTQRSKQPSSGKRSQKSTERQDDTPGSTGTEESDGPSTSAHLRQVI